MSEGPAPAEKLLLAMAQLQDNMFMGQLWRRSRCMIGGGDCAVFAWYMCVVSVGGSANACENVSSCVSFDISVSATSV